MKFPSFTITKDVQRFLDKNSPLILTGMAVAGAITTAVLSVRAGKLSEIDLQTAAAEESRPEGYIYTPLEELERTWKNYIAPVGVLTGTCGCMIMATKIGLNRTAALGAALAVSQKAYDEYTTKVRDIQGEKQHTKIVDAVAKDQVQATQAPQYLTIRDNKVMCLDRWSGRLFESSMEDLRKALNDFNYTLTYSDAASLTEFYTMIGLDETTESDNIGWNSAHPLDLHFTSVLKNDQVVLAFQFDPQPKANFDSPHP